MWKYPPVTLCTRNTCSHFSPDLPVILVICLTAIPFISSCLQMCTPAVQVSALRNPALSFLDCLVLLVSSFAVQVKRRFKPVVPSHVLPQGKEGSGTMSSRPCCSVSDNTKTCSQFRSSSSQTIFSCHSATTFMIVSAEFAWGCTDPRPLRKKTRCGMWAFIIDQNAPECSRRSLLWTPRIERDVSLVTPRVTLNEVFGKSLEDKTSTVEGDLENKLGSVLMFKQIATSPLLHPPRKTSVVYTAYILRTLTIIEVAQLAHSNDRNRRRRRRDQGDNQVRRAASVVGDRTGPRKRSSGHQGLRTRSARSRTQWRNPFLQNVTAFGRMCSYVAPAEVQDPPFTIFASDDRRRRTSDGPAALLLTTSFVEWLRGQ